MALIPGTTGPRGVLLRMGIHASRIRRIAQRANTHWLVDAPDRRIVLRRYAPGRSPDDVAYELRLMERLARRGWPAPIPIAPPVEAGGRVWCALRYLPGRAPAPRSSAGDRAEQRRRGRLLAHLHADMADFAAHGQRPGFIRADAGLIDRPGRPPAGEVLARFERASPDQGRILRVHAERTRERLDALLPHAPAPIVIHGDFAPWNLRYAGGKLSAVLDFEFAHVDLRVADFALAWRARHDDVLRGYEEVSPLEPVERELLVPIYCAWIISAAVAGIDAGETGAEWTVRHLLRVEPRGAG